MNKLAVPLALIIGAAIGFFARPLVSGDTEPASDSEVAQLRTENKTLRAQLAPETASPTGKLPTAILPDDGTKTSTISESGVTITSSSGDLPTSINLDFGDLGKAMEQQQKKQDERRIALELAQLKDRLGLSPEQEEGVRALLEARAANQRGGLSKLMSLATDDGASGEAVEELLAGKADTFEADLAALLSDDQQASYDAYTSEKRRNQIEISANQSLTRLQSLFPLSEDQKDRAFEAFTALATESESQPGSPVFSPIAMNAGREKELAALEPILTPEQMEVYENSPSHFGSTMIFNAGEGSIGTSNVISTIQIDATGGEPLILSSPSQNEE